MGKRKPMDENDIVAWKSNWRKMIDNLLKMQSLHKVH